ncbi:MAG: hypothetical protein FWD41_03415 [Actinomycetia bacterium]|nr:hypothetical protein [Actinomycetes bacterium]
MEAASQGGAIASWIWIVAAILLGLIAGAISYQLRKKTAKNRALLEEAMAKKRDREAGHYKDGDHYRDDYKTTEAVMERAVLEDRLPIDSIEN